MVQLMGEDKGFDYLKKLHKNINQYTKSGAAPAKATALGETLVGITFMHDIVTFAVQGDPVKIVSPCEGTGYEIGSQTHHQGRAEPGERQEVVRLGAHARGPGAGRPGQGLPGAVQQEGRRPAPERPSSPRSS